MATDPGPGERSVGDVIDPFRPGQATDTVNAVSRGMGMDVAGWSWDRIVSMAATLQHEARQRDA